MPKTNYFQAAVKQAQRRKLTGPYFIIPVLVLFAIFLYLFFQNNSSDRLEVSYRTTMDTSVELRFVPGSSKESGQVREDVFTEIERLEELFSRSISGSEISQINNSAGRRPVSVSPEVIYVTEKAIDYANLSSGAFDPTIAPLIDLWGFLGQNFRLPGITEIEETLPLVDYTLLEIDSSRSTIYLPREGMSLELGGIAKGYIVDQALQVLIRAGIEHAFINAGGDIGLIGAKPDGSPWRIGVRHPREENEIIAILPSIGGAVVTSGDYQRTFEENSISYHHILNPETGMPSRELVSVTIVAPTATEADALSTAVFVLGPARGMALIESMPKVEGVLITPDLKLLVSSGLEGIIEIQP